MDQADYVLGKFTDEQWTLVGPSIDRAADAVETFVKSGLDAAMNKFNAPDRSPAQPRPRKERPPDVPPTA
jgi:PTH1 family peptidyl-tRNA hydrolase